MKEKLKLHGSFFVYKMYSTRRWISVNRAIYLSSLNHCSTLLDFFSNLSLSLLAIHKRLPGTQVHQNQPMSDHQGNLSQTLLLDQLWTVNKIFASFLPPFLPDHDIMQCLQSRVYDTLGPYKQRKQKPALSRLQLYLNFNLILSLLLLLLLNQELASLLYCVSFALSELEWINVFLLFAAISWVQLKVLASPHNIVSFSKVNCKKGLDF